MATWGARRQYIIEGVAAICGVAILIGIGFLLFYKAPSCVDGKQDHGEEGVDCGGPCPYLCSVSVAQPVIRFATAVSPSVDRTDVIAYIDNSNSLGGVQHAAYTVELRATDGSLIAQRMGTISLPPSTTAPLYLSNVYDGTESVSQAYVTLASSSLMWLRSYQQPIAVTANGIQIVDGTSAAPKVTATLLNPTAHTLYGVTVVATVFDAAGNAIAASQTVVSQLPPQGSAPLVFTWNEAYRAPAARVEILPATGS